ncbi:MAG: GNAT family N-acetyltransferase [Flavobacteriales bacterium]|nr:GNAT family N-acetyltransferase [Flavobacteriales bacterium]
MTLPELTDAKELFELRSNPEFMKYIGKYPIKEISEAQDYIQRIQDQFKAKQGVSWKISEKGSDRFIGYIGFWQIEFEHFRTEIGYGLHSSYQGKGYMKEALNLLTQYAFKELNIHSIKADIDPLNVGSRQLLLACGFKKEAYIRENYFFDGEFIDSEYYGIIQSDIRKKP